jgi:lipopolysaccharide/colanic/teichoic acid biosynthesis glycosyltransferase
VQRRVGKDGALFSLIKLRTMRVIPELSSCVTAENDARITRVGSLLRKLKIDELPQLFNVLAGHMSLVGPRPDVPGFADQLTGEDRIVLSIRPGVTGPASLKFRNEEQLLADAPDPEKHNRDVIWPEKVRINVDYIKNYSLMADVKCILWTVFPRKNA